MEKLLIEGIKSKTITEKDAVMESLKNSLEGRKLKSGDIVVISSKVVALTEGKTVKVSSQKQFKKLVMSEADEFYGGEKVMLAKKNNIFAPWAGIDHSNSPRGTVILWPQDPFKSAYDLVVELKKIYKIKKLGVIVSDSICMPLRRGVTAIALGYAGFFGVTDLRGEKDIYGKSLLYSQQNMADMLAAGAHAVMGEAAEKTPFALVRGAKVNFTAGKPAANEPIIPMNECIFGPLYRK